MHVYVWEHIVIGFCYRTAWWMFKKLGWNEVLMVPKMDLGVSDISTQGRIQGRGVPSSEKLLFQTGRLQQPTECIEII